MIIYVIIVAVYLVGVIVALAVLAWINADEEAMGEWMAVFSWFTLVFIVLVVVGYFATRPFNWFYEKMKAYFER